MNAADPGVVELYCVLSAEATAPDHPAHAYFVERYDRTRADLERAFREADDDGLQVQWLLQGGLGSDLDMAAVLRAHLDGLLRHPRQR